MALLKKILISYFVLLGVFTLLMICAHAIPKSAIKENIITSTHVLEEEGLYKKFFNFKLFQMDNFTDACMLNLAATADSNKPVDAGMMNYICKSEHYMDLAFDTENVAKGKTDGFEMMPYGRYWQGHQVTLRPALTVLSYPQIRILNYVLFSFLLIGVFVLMVKKISKAVAVVFAASLLLINFPIVPLSLQFSTCFYIAFISMILIMQVPKLTATNADVFCSFFVIGAVTSYMDFLTTPQLTLGLPLIVFMLTKQPKDTWRTVALVCLFWGLGYALLWASKWMIAYMLTGNNILADAMQSAELRTSNKYKGMEMTIPNIINFIWVNIKAKGLVGLFYAGLTAIVAFCCLYAKMLKNCATFKAYSWLLGVAMIVPVWFLVLRNHSIQHGWFTWRAGLLSLFSMLLFIYYTTDKNKLFKKIR